MISYLSIKNFVQAIKKPECLALALQHCIFHFRNMKRLAVPILVYSKPTGNIPSAHQYLAVFRHSYYIQMARTLKQEAKEKG